MTSLNRRQFLAAAGTTVALISLPVLQANAQTSAPAAGLVDVGPLTKYGKDGVTDTWSSHAKGAFFVIRDGGRLFAASSLCTHRNALLKLKGDELFCPKHHSEFTFQGTVTDGPAQSSLPRYAISVNPAGHVTVDTSKSFSEVDWDDKASYIPVKS